MSTELAKTAGSLAIRPDQTNWTPEQAAVLRQGGIDNDVTPAELSGFLHLSQRTGLDPFTRQVYLIGRWDNRQKRKVFTPQTSIDGYRVIAHRVVAAAGHTLGYEDTLWCDASGRWYDVWLSDEAPAAAKVVVVRNGQRFPAVAKYSEYVQRGKEGKVIGLWGKMPATMTAKCAEALALRMAFPHDLAGVYTAEEMAQADNPEPERHLRSVQPGEADPWATPVPQQAEQKFAPHAAGQQHADDAAKNAKGKDHINARWKQAASLLASQILAPDTKQPDELGAYLMRLGAILPDIAPPAQSDGDTVTDAEFVDPVAEAEQQLRATAARVGLDTLDADFEQSYGLPIAEAGVQQINEMNQLLTGSAGAA